MKLAIHDKDDRLEIALFFPDSRLTDLDSALRLAGYQRWEFTEVSKSISHLEYKITSRKAFLAEVRFTHGLEPPTRVLFENRQPETQLYGRALKPIVLAVVRDFLEECANRGLVSQAQKQKALNQLSVHDPALVQAR